MRVARYKLRTLLCALLILSVLLALWVKRARDQAYAVDELTKVHARVVLAFNVAANGVEKSGVIASELWSALVPAGGDDVREILEA